LKHLAAPIPPACCKNGAFVDSLWLWRGSDRQRAGDLLSYDRRFDLEEFSSIRGVPPHRTGFEKVFAGDLIGVGGKQIIRRPLLVAKF
jgi:hypothetical protein